MYVCVYIYIYIFVCVCVRVCVCVCVCVYVRVNPKTQVHTQKETPDPPLRYAHQRCYQSAPPPLYIYLSMEEAQYRRQPDFTALVWESTILRLIRPPAKPTLLHYYCTTTAQYTTPLRPLYCTPYTIHYWSWQYRVKIKSGASLGGLNVGHIGWGGPSTGPTPRVVAVVSPCRCEPLRAGCCGGEGVLAVS